MRKKIIAFVLAGCMILSAAGCRGKGEESPLLPQEQTEDTTAAETAAEAEPEEEEPEEISVFEELKGLQFTFSSGAGGWATELYIHTDGTFSGEYFDSEMGDTGEGYPEGSLYQSAFTGIFTKPVKVNEFTYCMKIQEISYGKEPGTEEIKENVRNCYTEANGLNAARAEDILLYRPGAPLAELPEEYKYWAGCGSDMQAGSEDTGLSFWGLYNVAEECGFTSCNIADTLKDMADIQKEAAALLKQSMNTAASQSELNDLSYELYQGWDGLLNRIWDVLKLTLEEEEMDSLITEQREWITEKEQAAKEAGAEAGGGSAQPMLVNSEAAAWTEKRVYELLELLEPENI